MNRSELLDLIPGYVLGALEPAEKAEVEALLRIDAEAKALADEYAAMSDVLVMTAPARQSPSHLTDDLRERLRTDRKDRMTYFAPPQPKRDRPPQTIDFLRKYASVLGGIAAAAVLVLLLGAGLVIQILNRNPGEQLYAQLIAQSESERIPVTAGPDMTVSGELVVASGGRQAVIAVRNLPSTTADQTFQLWLIDDTGAQSAGLFELPSDRNLHYILVPLESPITSYQAVGLSLEPEGGSPLITAPSGPNVFAVPL
jgi:anti-sigma-K factor RskA